MFTKVKQTRAFESIIQQVESAIVGGSLNAGDRLPSERELQGVLDVSRNTLRESLRVLEQKGLVEIRKGNRGGIFVKGITADSMTDHLGLFVRSRAVGMEDISEFRRDLEGLVTRRAALRASPAAAAELALLLRRVEESAQGGPGCWEEFMQADKEIHLALARIGGNPLHHFFLETVHNNLHRYHITRYLPRTVNTIRTTLSELKAIVAAVTAGEAEQAETLARNHIRHATTAMKKRASAEHPRPLPRSSLVGKESIP